MVFSLRVSIVTFALLGSMLGCQKNTPSLNQGLQDEKSYTRRAMETYRKNPTIFQQNKSVLETWSKSDYIAVDVAQQKKLGSWAESSDKLTFLDPTLRYDTAGRPFCVIHQDDRIIVLSIRSAGNHPCLLELINGLDIDRINSGDMEFSGRTDYWIYVLRLGQLNSKSDEKSKSK